MRKMKPNIHIDDLKVFGVIVILFIIFIVTIPYWLPVKIYYDLNDKNEDREPTGWANQPNIFGEH
jgi:hypothetical protein